MVMHGANAADRKIGSPTTAKRNTNGQHVGKELAKAPAALNSNIKRFDDSPAGDDAQASPIRTNKIIFLPLGKP